MAGGNNSRAHGSEIRNTRDTREVLHEHPRRAIRNLLSSGGIGYRIAKRLDVFDFDRVVVLESQQVLEQYLERNR